MSKLIAFACAFVFCTFSAYSQDYLIWAQRDIEKIAVSLNLTEADLAGIEVSDHHRSRINGAAHVYFQQKYRGIDIENRIMGLHYSESGKLVTHTSRFVLDVDDKFQEKTFNIDAHGALMSALNYLDLNPASVNLLQVSNSLNRETRFEATDIAIQPIVVKTIIIEREQNLHLVWIVGIHLATGQNFWALYVDIETGEILKSHDRIIHCSFGYNGENDINSIRNKEKVHQEINKISTTNLSHDQYTVYPVPVESPNHGSRSIVSNPADANASPFGWHDTDGISGAEFTITRGNNAFVREDKDATDGTTGFSADGGDSLEFKFPLDFAFPLTFGDNLNAAMTNLFYWNNVNHDIWYQYGFTEECGNFQENNYGNGGLGSDVVDVDAQDGGGINNANFCTPADGQNPRMQMFIWTYVLSVNLPLNISRNFPVLTGLFGDQDFLITGDLVIVDDGSASPTELCSPPLINDGAIAGNIALIDRGNCEFGSKVLAAQNAGAIAVIICNNVPGQFGEIFEMGGGVDGDSVTIPAMMIRYEHCQTIRAEIPTVNITINSLYNDSSLDAGIISHEYGHGISNRLTGGPSNVNCLNNNEQGGEGWSDWFGLVLTHESGDTRLTSRGIGTYVRNQPTTGGGIRTFPYSTDFAVNSHTYSDISASSSVHFIGSVLCAILWEVYWDLVDANGYDSDLYNGTGGNNIAMSLVIEGLKLQPCSPGFVDVRDAILTADTLLYGGANSNTMWNSFARRGLGFSADQGSSFSYTDGTEAFDLPPGVSLPVELISFDVLVESTSLKLIWSTASEINNKGFEIHRSTDGQIFSEIDWVASNGNSTEKKDYVFIDNSIFPGIKYYYRLKQIDLNGEFKIHPIRSGLIESQDAITVYPTLIRAGNIISIVNNQNSILTSVEIDLYDMRGKRIHGMSLSQLLAKDRLEMIIPKQLPAGAYNLRIESKNDVQIFGIFVE